MKVKKYVGLQYAFQLYDGKIEITSINFLWKKFYQVNQATRFKGKKKKKQEWKIRSWHSSYKL